MNLVEKAIGLLGLMFIKLLLSPRKLRFGATILATGVYVAASTLISLDRKIKVLQERS